YRVMNGWCVAVVGVELHPVHTQAEGQGVGGLEGDRRIDVDAFDREFFRVITAGPALLVFGHQTERRAHAQPQPDARIHFPGEIGVGQIGRASGREGVERAGVTVTDQGTKNTKTEDGKAEEVATTVATLQTVAIA